MKRFEQKQAGLLTSSELKTFRGQLMYWIFILCLTVCVAIALIPAIWTVSSALKDSAEILDSSRFFPSSFSWSKLIGRLSSTWTSMNLSMPMMNTFIRSIGEVLFKIVICGLIGYSISKLKPTGSKALFVAIVWTMMLPSQIRMVSNYIGWMHYPFAADNGLGVNLLDTFWPFWIGSAADCFGILLFKNAFDGLSDSYVEAAKIDGATNVGIFFRIMAPLSMPIIIYQSIMTFNVGWADYMGPLLYLNKTKTVPLVLYLAKTTNVKMNDQFMAYVISCIPPLIIFIIFQKQILGGVNVGGVKG